MGRRTVVAVLLVAVLVAALSGCARKISKEQYIDAIVAVGCKNLAETSPEAQALYKEKGFKYEDIVIFRKGMKPAEVAPIVNEIATRVMACHGVTP